MQYIFILEIAYHYLQIGQKGNPCKIYTSAVSLVPLSKRFNHICYRGTKGAFSNLIGTPVRKFKFRRGPGNPDDIY